MLFRIWLIIAIVAGLAAGALTFTKVQDIIKTTRAERNDWHNKDVKEVADHNKTKNTLKTTQATLDTTKASLAQTKNQLTAANNKVDELTKNVSDLTTNLEKVTADRDTAQQQLEQWRQLGVTPDQIKGMQASLEKTVKEKDAVIGENKLLAAKVHDWENRWNNYFNSGAPVVLPAGLRGKIVAVDPKYNFVVLNIGDDQGVLERGEMMVDRDGKLLGKVRIVSVKKDECVANILPEWKQGEIVEGDEVLY